VALAVATAVAVCTKIAGHDDRVDRRHRAVSASKPNARLRAELLRRYGTSAREYIAAVRETDDGRVFERVVDLPSQLPIHVVDALDLDWIRDGDPVGYRCRRCLAVHGLDHGGDDLPGLCDDCFCAVDELRERWREAAP